MKNAKQLVFILIGIAMILLSVGVIVAKKSNDTRNGVSEEAKSGSRSFSMPINSLIFEAGACEVEILEGEGTEYLIDYENIQYENLVAWPEGNTLKISYKQSDDWVAKVFYADEIREQKITLIVPKDTVFDSALFEFGAADIEMEGITAKELYITVGAGALDAESLTATELAKFNVGAGTFNAEDTALTNAELVCGVGEMDVSGIFDGDTKVDCGVGSMELLVYGEREQYHGELNCGLGEIRCGNIQIEGSGNKDYGTSSAERRMDIKCGIGEVDVRFYN